MKFHLSEWITESRKQGFLTLLHEKGWFQPTRVKVVGLMLLLGLAVFCALSAKEGTFIAANSGEKRELPIYCVKTEEPKIALSFDAAWGNEDTREILNILKEENVKVTFFMTGGWVEKYPDDVKTILADGHDLGNHSENHKQMSKLSDEECKNELAIVHNRVKELTGYEMCLFRPPYGDYNNSVIRNAAESGYFTIQWDVDSLDWKDYGADSIVEKVCNHKHLGNGSIILCHNGAKFTAKALKPMIQGLKEKGYTFVPISELIYRENYTMDHEGRQIPKKQ